MHTGQNMTATTEEYLEWICRLSMEQKKVTASELSRSLKVSQASVTSMLKRLVEQGLVNHQAYGVITLTPAGREVGARVIRRHGLLERLLCDVLGVAWYRVDEVVCQIEHYLDDDVEDRLDTFLNHPTTCPHGQPINFDHVLLEVRLSEISTGQSGTVARMGDESPDFLKYIQEMGILPGVNLRIKERQPFGGSLILTIGERECSLGEAAARRIWMDQASIYWPPASDSVPG